MKFWNFALAGIVLLISNSVNAAVITYDESVNGDLAGGLSSQTYLGNLDIGINSISGEYSWTDFLITDDDTAAFTVSDGHQINSLFINYDYTPDYQVAIRLQQDIGNDVYTDILNFNIGLDDPSSLLNINFISSDTDILIDASLGVLGSGNYRLGSYGMRKNGSDPSYLNYKWSMNVSAVPVPAAAWLFGSGLIGLVGFARRK